MMDLVPVKTDNSTGLPVYARSYNFEQWSNLVNFVKEINGIYVLQAGSYANAQKAEIIAKEINALGFPTKVVKE